ncbi:tellurite resistance TerB family protein [Paracoccus aurantiacus]|uniref:Tellurite resistance TerB family protein n=1 Tax=Paracoccus aurantiacus TaxID=2599412 RepID=A0A5C6S7N9_9RHOB|nr:tellurite resistance TerB family protein [Paracoccus aurantiacus]TXB70081.1 tellurite resistance TerB family protein [Paracoccus aurantiacus]
MSLMKSLARVAAGVLVAKGMSTMMKNRTQSQQTAGRTTSRRSGGGLLDELTRGSQSQGGSGGGLGDLLGGILGGNTSSGGAGTGRRYGGPNSTGATGGLGGILDQLTNGARGGSSSTSGGGLGGILDQLTGGAKTTRTGQSGGGIGDLLGGLLGGAAAGSLANKGAQQQNDASFGELLNDSLSNGGEPEVAPTPEQNAVAGLMLRAMIQAAKADGKIDDAEKERLMGQLGDLDDEERQFIREQMAAPVDAKALASDVPDGLGPQVYLMSVMAIDFDSQEEAQYLHQLAQALGIQPQTINQIHEKIGVQNLYS